MGQEDNRSLQPPNDNTDWFQRHILEKLGELGDSQKLLMTSHQETAATMTKALTDHTSSDAVEFTMLHADITSVREDIKPIQKIIYSAVAMILMTVFGAIIFLATGHTFVRP